MKSKIYSVIFIISVFLISCNNKNGTTENKQIPKVQVSTTGITEDYLPEYTELTGKTVYFNKNNIIAPVSGYVIKVNVKQGDKVPKGKLIFKIQSPEAYMLQKNDSLKKSYGIVDIYAPAYGTVTGITVMQEGVFTDKGSALCMLTASGNLKIQVEVPFEYAEYAKIGKTCKVILPDNSSVFATFSKILPKMNDKTQTISILANLKTKRFIPENMIVKVLIEKGINKKTQILPKKCVMTDALMNNFWVMKLINDTTAVKISVKKGKQNHKQIEILYPRFTKEDKFISEGAYGLSDTVFVEVIK